MRMPKYNMNSTLVFAAIATTLRMPITSSFGLHSPMSSRSPYSRKSSDGLAGAARNAVPPRREKITELFASESEDADGIGKASDEAAEKKRMEMVRSLQQTFYRSPIDDDDDASSCRSRLDENTGIVNDVPLWRVGWVETPGRSNCLNVHEGKYTHMFETLLSQPEPRYFGHLHLPGGSKSTRSGMDRYTLRTWKEELRDEMRFEKEGGMVLGMVGDRSAVVGCLMRITDHRRMEDGRLMILVHAVERFVVEEVTQEKPYAVANVQILLDSEDLEVTPEKSGGEDSEAEKGSSMKLDENFQKGIRARAAMASSYYRDYEFANKKLPVQSEDDYLSQDSVEWLGITKLLPFAYYSEDDISLDVANLKTDLVRSAPSGGFTGGEAPMEKQLCSGGILWNPPSLPGVTPRKEANCDALETLLWLTLDDFCRATGFVIPEEVLCLMPPSIDYLDMPSPEKRISSKYPAIRRQRRLSYLAPAFIESLNLGKDMRQIWLNTPSTKARLLGVLQRYEFLNNQLLGTGEFE